MTSAAPPPPVTGSERRAAGALRLDIEGLRAVAIVTVLLFHAGLPWFPGGFVGVDVFFVLSGFLITGLLVREVTRTGRVRLARFWARRARRLLPASAVVLVFSAIASAIWLPVTQRSDFGGDIVASGLYVVNWRLADRSVDYLAEDVGASPVQHFWSLAVEEQFYLVWPLLMLAVAVLVARRPVLGAAAVLGVITVSSFAYAVQQSVANPETAFFVSTTRVWELGVGALLALAAQHVARVPGRVRGVLGWAGLGAILVATVAFDGSTTWPGPATLVPVLGAAAVIASGLAPTPNGPGRLLSLAPLVWIGALSYSLYLWHWPILVVGQATITDFGPVHGVALTLLSVLPAWLSLRYVENPVRFGARFRPSRRALQLGAGLTATSVAAGLVLSVVLSLLPGGVQQTSVGEAVGAAALEDPRLADVDWSAQQSVDRMRPLPLEATEDRPALYDEQPECQVDHGTTEPELCEFGDTSSDRTVVIVGDSKMVQWQPALAAIGEREGFRLVQVTKSSCVFTATATARDGEPYRECQDWGDEAQQRIIDLAPELVITSGRQRVAYPEGGSGSDELTQDAMVDGLVERWSALTAAGIPVVALLDNPAPEAESVYECVAQNADQLVRCTFDRADGASRSGAPAQLAAAARVDGVGVLDMNDVICPDGDRCAAVIGGVLVYRQGTHLTDTFVRSAQPQLEAALAEATDGLVGAGS